MNDFATPNPQAGDDATAAPFDDTSAPDLLLGEDAPVAQMVLAQGVICHPWALAFNFDWARTILDAAELSVVPKSPPWLRGALNFDGDILPVIDLAVYLAPNTSSASAVSGLQRGERLLVGGFDASAHNKSEAAMAIIFTERPQQLNFQREPIAYMKSLPARLQEICNSQALGANGTVHLEIDVAKLLSALSADLAAQ